MKILHLITSIDRGGRKSFKLFSSRTKITKHDVYIIYLKETVTGKIF